MLSLNINKVEDHFVIEIPDKDIKDLVLVIRDPENKDYVFFRNLNDEISSLYDFSVSKSKIKEGEEVFSIKFVPLNRGLHKVRVLYSNSKGVFDFTKDFDF